jgi:N-acetylmuramoyl-L-alanine amidase
MGSEIINDKERTNNIYIMKLIAAIFMSLLLSGMTTDIASEKKWVIVIDAGHGGKDPGAIGTISKEKNINLAIALKLGGYLEQNLSNVKVLYTRKTDVFPGLNERAEFANKNEADLFISIHTNSLPSKRTIKGTETFIMGPSKDEQNLEVAMKENEVIMLEDDYTTKYEGFDPKSPESYIIFSLMQNVFQEQSTDLASKIQSQFKNRAGRIDRGVKQDVFWVIYMTSMPSVLVETGFITNPDEEKYLVSDEGQDLIASAIYRATRDYINEIDKKTNISTSNEKEQIAEPDSSYSDTLQVVDDLKFMIQIATSTEKKRLLPENFKGIKDVVELSSLNLFRYAAGSFSNYSQAAEFRKKLEVVYPDAFVIAVKNNKILPLQDALNPK